YQVERDQTPVHERPEHLRKQRVERFAMLDPEGGDRRATNANVAADPAESRVRLNTALDLARAANALADRVEPQRQQHAHAGDVPPLAPFDRFRIAHET